MTLPVVPISVLKVTKGKVNFSSLRIYLMSGEAVLHPDRRSGDGVQRSHAKRARTAHCPRYRVSGDIYYSGAKLARVEWTIGFFHCGVDSMRIKFKTHLRLKEGR